MLDVSGQLPVRVAWLNDGVGKFPPGPETETVDRYSCSTV